MMLSLIHIYPGGSLSIADLLSCLYFYKMRVDPKNPKWEDRDRLVLSKGHCAPGLYAALALKGYFPVEELKKLDVYKRQVLCRKSEKTVPAPWRVGGF